MREAMIIVPKFDNNGRDLSDVLESVFFSLSAEFGGCTVTDGYGCWVRPQTGELVREPVWQVTAACHPVSNGDAATYLENLADFVGEAGQQDAVYIRYPSGKVVIRDTKAFARA